MRSGEVVKGLEKDDAPAHLLSVFAETPTFSDQWSQRLTQRQVDPLNQTGADGQAKLFEPFGSTQHTLRQFFKPSPLLMFDDLRVDQLRMGFHHGFARSSWLARASKLLDVMIDLSQPSWEANKGGAWGA